MPSIRNVLQQRADRFRSKNIEKKLLREDHHLPLSFAINDRSDFTDEFIKPQIEPDGDSSGYMYSLEAKDTHATAVETFSSGEENTTYSEESFHFAAKEHDLNTNFSEYDRRQLEDGGEFLDLAYEASHQGKNTFRGHEFIDLVQDSSRPRRIDVENSNCKSYEEDANNFVPKNVAQPETIEFVDSEDGKVFNITQEITKKESIGRGGLLQNVRSLDDSNTIENDECSKTLNTNTETLQTMPSLNDDDAAKMNFSNRLRNLHVDIGEECENFEECDLQDEIDENGDFENCDFESGDFENGDYDEGSLPHDNSQLYDCDDGEIYFPVGASIDQQGNVSSGQDVHSEEDGTFFEQLRTVQSRHVNDYQPQLDPMGIVDEEVRPEYWQSLTNQIHSEIPQDSYHNNRTNDRPVSSHLEDPYLSDGNSSWEEGSFATGASRTVSRVDNAHDDYDEDDAGTYDGTYDGTEYYSDDDTYAKRNDDQPLVRILKKFRDMNVDEEQSHSETSDEEEDETYGNRKRSNNKQKRRIKSKKSAGTIFGSIREIGTDILEEAIDYAERQDIPSGRRKSGNQGGTIMDTFADLFSCGAGAPSQY